MKSKKQNGITLIALVITIIVLLILAGITINLTIGENGIIRRAQEAGKNYVEAANDENVMLQEFENLTDNIITNVTGTTGGTSTPVTPPAPTIQNLADVAKPGDYVEYDGGNGYTDLWQVLYNDSTYGLQIISSTSVGTYTLGGSTEAEAKASYNNAVDTLNSECAKYINTSYATSGRSVGSNPLSPTDATKATVTLQFPYNGSTNFVDSGSTNSGCKVADTNYEIDENAMKSATNQSTDGIHKIGSNYWVASRYVNSTSKFGDFRVRWVNSSGNAGDGSLWEIWSDGYSGPHSHSSGVRPVVTLKSGIQTNGGDGSSGSPFKLVAM